MTKVVFYVENDLETLGGNKILNAIRTVMGLRVVPVDNVLLHMERVNPDGSALPDDE